MNTANTMSHDGDQINAGALIGRPDLSDDVLLDALRQRLRARQRPETEAEGILAAATMRDEAALALMQTLSVPAPVAHLSMPTQRLTGRSQRRWLTLPAINVSWSRG
ncbi:hypothetical protein [Jiella sp. M17.18]|uniref:hypothetical protein n=1 Tax=Jiella sp. M17.18 TaxID=3234247 RepID=UPI0034E04E79